MQLFDFKKYKLDLFIILGFIVLSLIYCYPQLQGKVLYQGDVVSWKGAAHEAMAYHDSTGKNTLWTNSMFGGMPTYTIYVPENTNYIANIQHALTLVGKPAYFLFIAMLCFFILMRTLNVNKWLAVVGAIAYAFSTYNIELIIAGHETKLFALDYLPAVIAGFLLLYNQKWWTGIPLFAISFVLMLANNHWQIVYYSGIIFVFAGIGQLVAAAKEGKIKGFIISSVVIVIIAAISLGTTMAGFLTTKEYTNETMRGGSSQLTLNHEKGKTNGGLDKDYAFMWSNAIGETFCMLVPQLYGGSNSENVGTSSNTYDFLTKSGVSDDQATQFAEHIPLYWGPQPIMSGPVYYGAIICFLFVLGLLVIKNHNKWWILAVCILATVMSWGKHFPAFNYFLFDHLPMYNKFRIPAMIMVIPELLFPILGIWAVNDIISGKLSSEEIWRKVKTAGIITVGLCLVLGVGGSMFFSFRDNDGDARMAQQYGKMFNNQEAGNQLVKAIQQDRSSAATKSGLTSALYIILAGGLLWAYSKNKIKTPLLIGGLGLLIAIDLMSEDVRYLNNDAYVDSSDYDSKFEPRPVDKQINADHDPYYRVLDLSVNTYNDAAQCYFHKCVGGYSPAKMEIYQDLIDVQISQQAGKFNSQVLNMLNTKYFILPGPNGEAGARPNPDACGNAWFVNDVKWVNTADEEMLSLNANNLGDTAVVPNAFNPKTTAVIRNDFKNTFGTYTFGKDSAAAIKLTKYGLDDLSFTSSNSKDGLAVFSDIWYPHGWEAYVDGKETPIMRANYVLRAIKIPAGQHTIEFHFRPKSYQTGKTIAIISSFLIIGVCLSAFFQLYRNNKSEEKK